MATKASKKNPIKIWINKKRREEKKTGFDLAHTHQHTHSFIQINTEIFSFYIRVNACQLIG